MGIELALQMAREHDADRIAVGTGVAGLSVAVLDRLAVAVAHRIQARGAGTVAFLGTTSRSFVVTVFAAAYAGVPVCPLNYRLAPDRVSTLLDRLDEPLVVADAEFQPTVAGRSVLPSADLLAAQDDSAPPPVGAAEDDPAVLLFTSGTTAEPKCVRLAHQHLLAYLLETVDLGAAAASDATVVSVPPYHIAGVGAVLSNVYAGRRIVPLPTFDSARWLEVVHTEGVTSATLVPTMLARIVAHLGGTPVRVPTLRSIAYGGGRVPRSVLEEALRVFPDVGFVNAYGLTETSSTVALLTPEDHRAAVRSADPVVRARLTSVGRPVPGVEAQIRDTECAVLPADETGELWLRGRQISGSYVEAGSALDGDGWFPTRDRAYSDGDGYLFIEGRADDVIIRGGENITPAEVEDVLIEHPDVAAAAVLGVPDEEWGERLTAVVVPARCRAPEPEALRTFVRDRLRRSRTPDQIILRDALPTTETGKLLRRQLVAELSPR